MTGTGEHLFLSYSRRQFYFAENVVLSLQKEGVSVWFDVQELAPGEQWRDEIERGLNEAAGIMVIISEASMDSKYVRQEWEPIIEANQQARQRNQPERPVYLVLFEAADIPAPLLDNATAIIDLRGNFNKNINRLLSIIQGESEPEKDKLPRRWPWGLPSRLSFAVGLVVWLIILTAAFLLLGGFYVLAEGISTESIATTVLAILWLFYLGDTALNLLRREHTFRQVWVAILLTLPLAAIVFNVIGAAVVLAALVAYFLAPGMYRWQPTGQAPGWMRRRYGMDAVITLQQVAEELDKQSPPKVQRYTVAHAEEDTWIANRIEKILAEDQHQRVGHDAAQPGDQHILVLSNHTTVDEVQAMLGRHPDALTPVLANNVDSRRAVNNLGDFQFIDFREHSDNQLRAISLLYCHPEDAKIIYGLNVLPIGSSVLRFPPAVSRFNITNHLSFLLYILALLLAVPVLIESVDTGDTGQFASFVYFWGMWTLLAAGHVWLAHKIQTRTITFRRFTRVMIGLGVASMLSFTFAVPQAITLVAGWGGLKHWLPKQIEPPPSPTLPHARPHAARNQALRDAAIVILIVVVFSVESLLVWLGS